MRLRRFGGFVAGGAVTQGVVGGVVWCVGVRVRRSKTGLSQGAVGGVRLVCVGVRVRRSKTGLSHRVSVEVSSGVCKGLGSQSHRVSLEVSSGVRRGQGLQIQDRAVTQGDVGGVVWCVWGSGLADPRLWVRRSKTGLSSHRVSLKLSSDACRDQGLQI